MPVYDYAKVRNIGAISIMEEIRKYQNSPTAKEEKEKVKMATVDSLSLEKSCHLIKIDVEGFELEVIKGALNFIENNNFPPIIFEEWQTERFGDFSKKIQEKQNELRRLISYMGYQETLNVSENVFVQNPKNKIKVKKYKDDKGLTHLVRER